MGARVAKFWMYFKKAVLVWGFIWLAIVLVVGTWIFIESLPRHQSLDKLDQKKDDGFKKAAGDMELTAVHDEADSERVLISLSRKSTPLITDYELPTKEFGLQWVDINEADVIPTGHGEYRIIVQGGSYDCDQESAHYIWVLDYRKEMRMVKMLTLFGMHKVAGRPDRLFATQIVQLPAFDDEKFEQIDVPIELEIGKVVKVRSMLGTQNNELMRLHFGKIMDERMNKLAKNDNKELLEKYKAASAELKEALGKTEILY